MSLKHAILALLDIEQGSGYDLRTRFNNSIGCFWSATHQQIYKELATLADSGLVTYEEFKQEGKPDKKVYEVTDEGKAELTRWLRQPTKEMKVKDPFLIKVFAGAHLGRNELISDLKEHRKLHQETLSKYQNLEALLLSLPTEVLELYKLPYSTMKLGMKIENAWLEWCDELVDDIQKGKVP